MIRRVECIQNLVGLDVRVGSELSSLYVVGLPWCSSTLLIQKKAFMRQILLPLSKGLMTRSGLESSFLTMLSTSKVFDGACFGKEFPE